MLPFLMDGSGDVQMVSLPGKIMYGRMKMLTGDPTAISGAPVDVILLIVKNILECEVGANHVASLCMLYTPVNDLDLASIMTR